MKFRCERDTLVDALQTAGRAVSGRGAVTAATNGVRIEARANRLAVVGTDLDLTVHVEVGAVGLDDGVCVAPARLVADIARSLEPGAVTVEAGDDEVEISSGRSRFVVRTYAAEEFPVLPEAPAAQVWLAPAGLADALRQVVRAASTDDARPLLTGVLMSAEADGIRLVATDSYRLAWRDLPGSAGLPEGSEQILVPARALTELQRLLSASAKDAGRSTRGAGEADAAAEPGAEPATSGPAGDGAGGDDGAPRIGLSVGELDASFWVGGVRLTTRLLEGRFPDYRQLVPPAYPNSVRIAKVALIDALRRVRLLVRDNTTPVRLTMHPDGVDLSVVSQEVGQASESLDAAVTGEEVTIAFNPSYLIDGVEAAVGDDVLLEVVDATKPATVRSPERDDYRYLLMPVRVS